MMKTIVLVAAVAACAFAWEMFTPIDLPCKYKIYVDEFEDYFMMSGVDTGYIKMLNTANGVAEYIRCDYKNGTECKYIYDPENITGECAESWTTNESIWEYNISFYYNFLSEPFNYTNKTEVNCSDSLYAVRDNHTSTKCWNYTNQDSDYYIIADQDKYVIEVYSYYTALDVDKIWYITYSQDDFDEMVFNTTDCNKTELKKPVDVCPTKSSSSVVPPGPTPGPTPSSSASSSKSPVVPSTSSSASQASASSQVPKSFASTVYPAVAVLVAAIIAILF